MLVKYVVKKQKCHEWMVMCGYDYKEILFSELEESKKQGWEFVRKKIFLITDFCDFYSTSNRSDRLAIIGITVGLLAVVISIIGLFK
ncbi:hypothetical protein WH221_02490 [Chryseobacterium culicis]|uniref:Uncharacterized protein n=1 Tax=Chryseobacterium culicis TaxID=680127 RepID=A0A2S9CX93_CHRCI|nr:hypothetical protein [Chryseobacterium culicis]PRB85142.1 hypothetical protein CQ022_02430 [Chryseobacterium culicis]PRB91135.1 hypothetical protein CQ033_10560 [Chryseobacterium culicis]